MNPHHFLTMFILGCTQRECKPSEMTTEEFSNMLESRISAGATEKLPGCEKNPHAKTVSWSYDMEVYSRRCVETYCELAIKKVEQIHKRSSPRSEESSNQTVRT